MPPSSSSVGLAISFLLGARAKSGEKLEIEARNEDAVKFSFGTFRLEANKYAKAGEIDVMLSVHHYLEKVENPVDSADISKRMLVLVGVEEAVKSRDNLQMWEAVSDGDKEYEEAAKLVHKAFCNPLWVKPLHLPYKP
uniref:Uncharacterized protein n=1 Tax=Phytophthora ramorum TaxID=164328 RepID=H3H089_PHYRM